jgi:DNA-directed RNA polymerase specialized sigma subunit
VADLAEEHLRRFLTARAAGDAAAMRLWWEALVIDFHDRMDALIYLTHKGRLDEEEHELAKQLALTKFSKRLIETFRGGTIGELVNATKQLCRGVCIDVQRSSIRARRHAVASLDDTSSWEIEESRKRYEDASSAADAREFIAWALPQISDTYRPVLELTMYGATVPEIMDELDISQDNIYQRRRRGLQDLAKLKELYDT